MQRLKLPFTVLCFMIVSTSVAFAAAGGHEWPWKDFAYRIITFTAVVATIAYFFGRKITTFFKGRTLSIANEITSLETQKAETQQNLLEVEKRIANLEAERLQILNDYKQQGEAMKAAIIAEAEKTAETIGKQARMTAQSEIDVAIQAMRAELAEKIAEAAEQLLIEKLSAEEHSKLIDKYLTKVVLN